MKKKQIIFTLIAPPVASAALVVFFPAAGLAQSDPPCAELLSGVSIEAKQGEIEGMIAQSWLEMVWGEAAAGTRANILSGLLRALSGSDDVAIVFSDSFGSTNPDFIQALSDLSNWTRVLTEQGRVDRALLARSFREAIQTELVQLNGAETASTEADGARATALPASVFAPRPAEPEGDPVALPNGGFAFAGRDGRAYFYDRNLEIISPAEKMGIPDMGLVPLAGGNYLYFAHWGPTFVLDPAGNFIRKVDRPKENTTRSTVTPLPGGSVWVSTDGGAALILDANGNPNTPAPIRYDLAYRGKAVSLSDGTFWVGVGLKMVRFRENGEVLATIRAPKVGVAIQSLEAFEDGTLIIADHTRTFHFLNPDGSPRKIYRFFDLKHKAPARLSYPFYRTLSNHMAAANNFGEIELLDSNGGVYWKTQSYSPHTGPPIELSKDAFLFRDKDSKLVIDGPALRGPKLVPIPPGEQLDFRPKKLSDGTFVLTYHSGLVQVFSADGTLLYGHQLPSRASHAPVLLSDGRLLVVCMDLTLRVIDPSHVESI